MPYRDFVRVGAHITVHIAARLTFLEGGAAALTRFRAASRSLARPTRPTDAAPGTWRCKARWQSDAGHFFVLACLRSMLLYLFWRHGAG